MKTGGEHVVWTGRWKGHTVLRLLEEGGGTPKNVGSISKRARQIIRKGEEKKGLMVTLDREKINWTEKNTRNGEPPDWWDPRGTGKVMGRQKVQRTIHGRDGGKEARVRFWTWIGGGGTKLCVCGTGDGGTAKQNGGENEQGFGRD